MKKRIVILTCMFCSQVWASPPSPFMASCTEGETHRYDSSNGFTISGSKIKDPLQGWITEKWGGLEIIWDGGKTIKVGNLESAVLTTEKGVVSAMWAGANGMATNVYSFLIDLELGEAVYSQVHANSLGSSRQIKVRSQNLMCKIKLKP